MRVACGCGKTLKVADKPAGKKIRCPACREVLVAEEEMPEGAEDVPPLSASRKKSVAEPEEDDADRQRPIPKKGKKRAVSPSSFLSRYGLLLGIGGGMVVAGVVVLVILLNRGGPEDKRTPSAQDPSAADAEKLQGTWSVVSAVREGDPAPAEAIKDWKVIFKKDEMTIDFGVERGTGTFTLEASRTPKVLVQRQTEQGTTKEIRSLYKLEGETLSLCLRPGESTAPSTFDAKPGSGIVIIVLRRGR
jgi:uncharacterized protein (TIGR03067 family)